MNDRSRVTRREFLTSTVATAGIITVGHRLPSSPALAEASTPASSPAGEVSIERAMPQRIDGLPKVKGEKIYARDLRARDMPGWPRRPSAWSWPKTSRATGSSPPSCS